MGRPKIRDERMRRMLETVRLPRFIVEWLDHQRRSSGEVIEEALLDHYEIKAPGDGVTETTGEIRHRE